MKYWLTPITIKQRWKKTMQTNDEVSKLEINKKASYGPTTLRREKIIKENEKARRFS